MALGLNLGLGITGKASAEAAEGDWDAWDGSNDGAVTNLWTAGGMGSFGIAAANATEAVVMGKNSSSATIAVVLDVNTSNNTFKAETTNTAITLTQANATGNEIARLTDTKFVCIYENTTGSVGTVALLTKSGKTLTETDVETSLGLTQPNFRLALSRLNDTQAVAIWRDDGDSNKAKIIVIDITGDSITIGTAFDTTKAATDYPAICGLTDSSFMAATNDGGSQVGYYTVSGTTITQAGTLSVNAANGTWDDLMLVRIDDDTAILSYEWQGGSSVHVNVFSWSGSALSRGTEKTGIFGSNNIFQGTGTSTALGNRRAMFSARLEDVTPNNGAAVVCTVDESNVITVQTKVDTFPSIQADHDTVDAVPDFTDSKQATKVFGLCQDETTVTIQQIGSRIMVG